MGQQYGAFEIKALFTVQSGDFHSLDELDVGDVPLISCGDLNNGLIGYFDVPAANQYSHAITVAYNGSWPLTTKFHPYSFGAKDDVAVLTPIEPMSDAMLLYVGAMLNRMVWRYSYGRKCFKAKLQNVEIRLPIFRKNGIDIPDDRGASKLLASALESVRLGAKESVDKLLPQFDVRHN